MRKTLLIALSLTLTIAMVKAQAPATIRLTDVTLMHEMREAAIPENKAVISDRNVSFQWPLLADLKTQDSELKALAAQAALKKADKTKLRYKYAGRKMQPSKKEPCKPKPAGLFSIRNKLWHRAHGIGNSAT